MKKDLIIPEHVISKLNMFYLEFLKWQDGYSCSQLAFENWLFSVKYNSAKDWTEQLGYACHFPENTSVQSVWDRYFKQAFSDVIEAGIANLEGKFILQSGTVVSEAYKERLNYWKEIGAYLSLYKDVVMPDPNGSFIITDHIAMHLESKFGKSHPRYTDLSKK